MDWTEMIKRLCAVRDTLKLMDRYVEYRPHPIFRCIDMASPTMLERQKRVVEAVIEAYELDETFGKVASIEALQERAAQEAGS